MADSSPAPVPPASDAAAPRGRERVLAHAARLGIDVEVVDRPDAGSLEEAARGLGIAPSHLVKSLVVKRHDGGLLIALVPGDRQISWAKLRALVGVNKLSMPSPEVALEATGYERGTITPLGADGELPVYADERTAGRRIGMGGGEHGVSALVDADALVAALGATVGDITDELSIRRP
ncbi:aminoacyl-tRNA deacylase [Clavibacter michiganensis]|uniref:aminoacyl-tRNA deacylase n=2 Tax=Clavibacter michiganensis TaxID=28447 RepID=UPI000A372039|nr:YbaK/EbsC family protein [Clavibacter michiganensis]KAF0259515.1 Cys-tRNA(Pro)/Cys-tRNA(Cys) deacylase YbaK [Clavibacter michiganensis subsp. michiganensis]MBW8026604.1 YbaK/EbsC family protein [Clavibacter michiganensis subsp. michiganensis]MDO4019144.1 YbaK/EbsC family protein [Clavibacter michiganensis]MDO4024909.1 YbaK/EbsC family protein [Clavibacter michiganensis]MDO4030794.1 YbaK/EbsC family protein [Clavibacter michiganensis]